MQKRIRKQIASQKGMSVVGAMTASVVFSVVIIAFAQYMGNQSKAVRRINQKFAAIQTESLLSRALSDPLICSCIANNFGASFNTAGFNINRVHAAGGAGCNSATPTGDPIAQANTFLNNDKLLGMFVSGISVNNITFLQNIPAAPSATPPLPAQIEYSGIVTVGFENKSARATDESELAGYLKPISAKFTFLVQGSSIVGCSGAAFDRYYAEQIIQHSDTLDSIETLADAELQTVNDAVNPAVTNSENLIDVERNRIVAEARALLMSLSPPPPPPPPYVPPPPTVDCSVFSSAPAVLVSANPIGGDLVQVSAQGGVPAGTTGLEFQVNGTNRGSIAGGPSLGIRTATVATFGNPGDTLNIQAVSTNDEFCRSITSNTITVTLP